MEINHKEMAEQIQAFLTLTETIQKEYDRNRKKLSRMDKLTVDYLHLLELENLDAVGRAKTTAGLVSNLRERREYKDRLALLMPVADLLRTEEASAFLQKVSGALGSMRKLEQTMACRTYKFRVLDGKTAADEARFPA